MPTATEERPKARATSVAARSARQRDLTAQWTCSENDLRAVRDGCYFDEAAAEHVREFFRRFLRHSKGQWAGKPFELEEWQWRDLIGPLYGWRRKDGRRRFRVAFISMAKKNGKSALCSGLSLYHLVGDGEPGAEVYNAAADREQASIVFNEAAQMVRQSPQLDKRLLITPSTKVIAFPPASKLKALSADVPTKEGLNISCLIFDELHAQPNRKMWDTLRYGGRSRRQPLIIAITTAGWDRHSICYEQYDYAKRVARGEVPDTSFFSLIHEADEDADWKEEATWARANPNLGVTLELDSLREACAEAAASPTKQNSFRRYSCNQWVEQAERAIDMDAWDRCPRGTSEADLCGQVCWAGLDLSSTQDITALVLAFKLGGEERPDGSVAPRSVGWLSWFWVPAESATKREAKDRVPYPVWARQGLISLSAGNVIDYDQVRADIVEIGKRYNIQEIAVDPWNAAQMMTQLEGDGFEVVPFGQGYASMSAPTKEVVERLVPSGLLDHGGNPVMRWMAGNLAVTMDPAGNLKPAKDKSSERIDGMVAGIMAVGRAMVADDGVSVYETRGALMV